jgi:prepilin-type N-terminal cleavage/methylation domain-containing protein
VSSQDGRSNRSLHEGERGFTLAEVLIAIALLTIGVVGVAVAVGLQSGLASSMTSGHAAVTRGHYLSAATMLAQERLEQVKRLQWTLGPPENDQFLPLDANGSPPGFADEDLGVIAGFPSFSRQVRVVNNEPAGASMKTVTVTVTFRLPMETKISQESVALSTLIAARP